MKKRMRILSTGRCVGSKRVTNDDLTKIVDTSDEWISTRTGIKQRQYCDKDKGENAEWMACGAGREALERSGIDKSRLGLVLVATLSPDYSTPSLSCLVQRDLKLPGDIPALDINAACTGFIYGLRTAYGLLEDKERPYALVIGCEMLTRTLDFEDRSTCVLFGDGAGAVVVERLFDEVGQEDGAFLFDTVLGADGMVDPLYIRGLGEEDQFVHMDGQAVFRYATTTMERCAIDILEKNRVSVKDVSYVVAHQANGRIIDFVQKRMQKKFPEAGPDKFYKCVERYGNTSAASIPIALDELYEKGLLQKDMQLLLVGFGGGFTFGSAMISFGGNGNEKAD